MIYDCNEVHNDTTVQAFDKKGRRWNFNCSTIYSTMNLKWLINVKQFFLSNQIFHKAKLF